MGRGRGWVLGLTYDSFTPFSSCLKSGTCGFSQTMLGSFQEVGVELDQAFSGDEDKRDDFNFS